MARCKCNNPCNCYFEYDGDRPNTDYTSPYQYGRYQTRRTGSGSPIDPFVFEFLDSEEYQVESAQAHSDNDRSIPSFIGGSTLANISVLDYSTPYEVFLGFSIHSQSFFQNFFLNAHRFWMASAQATFVYNGTSTGSIGLTMEFREPGNYMAPLAGMVIAGNSSRLAGVDAVLSCSGFSPFVDSTSDPFFDGPGGSFLVSAQQSTGASMTIRNIRVTVVAM